MSEKRKAIWPYVFVMITIVICAVIYQVYPMFKNDKLPKVMTAASFSLPDIEGRDVTQADFDGRIRLMSFIFTQCPDICPITTANMVEIQKKLKEQNNFGNQVAFISATFDPDNDTPEVLKQYAERMGMDLAGWTLLRGKEYETIELASKFGISILRTDDGQFAHTLTSLLLIDGNNQVHKIYKMGQEMDNELILSDITFLLDELKD